MKILHYTLGIYPHRTGGLNRYATDLLIEQSKYHEVSVLMPGAWRPWLNKCRISNGEFHNGYSSFKLINALPLPLLYGIHNSKDFVGHSISNKSFEKFYAAVMPDVLHLHTLMGMPEDALKFFKEKGVKIVYTSHDYFGICPKVNLINNNGLLCEGPEAERCALCNFDAPSTWFLRIRNSSVVLTIRDVIKWLKNTFNL